MPDNGKAPKAPNIQIWLAIIAATAGLATGIVNRIWPEASDAAKHAAAVSSKGYTATTDAVNLLIERVNRLDKRLYRLEDLALQSHKAEGPPDMRLVEELLARLEEGEEPYEELEDPRPKPERVPGAPERVVEAAAIPDERPEAEEAPEAEAEEVPAAAMAAPPRRHPRAIRGPVRAHPMEQRKLPGLNKLLAGE